MENHDHEALKAKIIKKEKVVNAENHENHENSWKYFSVPRIASPEKRKTKKAYKCFRIQGTRLSKISGSVA